CSQSKAFLLSSRQLLHRLIETSNLKFVKYLSYTGLIIPCTHGIHLLDHLADKGLVVAFKSLFVIPDSFDKFIIPAQEGLDNCFPCRENRILHQVTGSYTFPNRYSSSIRDLFSGKDVQKCGFTGPISCNKCGLFAFFKSEGKGVEQTYITPVVGKILDGQDICHK